MEFYEKHYADYTAVTNAYKQSRYILTSDSTINGDHDLRLLLLKALASVDDSHDTQQPKKTLLDIGCGPSARDVRFYVEEGHLDAYGLDGSQVVIDETCKQWPAYAHRLQAFDLRSTSPLPFGSNKFDAVTCNAVIQHLDESAAKHTVQEMLRVLKPGGYLQLMFKCGQGTMKIHDADYKEDRCFNLYTADQIRQWFGSNFVETNCVLFSDPKPTVHCVVLGHKKL